MTQKRTTDISVNQQQVPLTKSQRISRTVLTPENLSASVLMGCKTFADADISDIAAELKRQTAAINSGDMTRAENMLVAQAHTLDGLFANLLNRGLITAQSDKFEMFMRLALKAQNQSRATLQTLNELKAPKQVAFVKQANIGNQVQVNNESTAPRPRAGKNQNMPNELLEVEHGERLDTRAKGAAGRDDPAMATVEKQHRAKKPRGQGSFIAQRLERRLPDPVKRAGKGVTTAGEQPPKPDGRMSQDAWSDRQHKPGLDR